MPAESCKLLQTYSAHMKSTLQLKITEEMDSNWLSRWICISTFPCSQSKTGEPWTAKHASRVWSSKQNPKRDSCQRSFVCLSLQLLEWVLHPKVDWTKLPVSRHFSPGTHSVGRRMFGPQSWSSRCEGQKNPWTCRKCKSNRLVQKQSLYWLSYPDLLNQITYTQETILCFDHPFRLKGN